MKKIIISLLVSLLIYGCNEIEDEGAPISRKEIKNNYVNSTVLFLTRSTNYKDKLVDIVTNSLAYRYSFIIDDIDKLYDYKTIDFHKVVFIENGVTKLESYFKHFTGRNNIILVAVSNTPVTPNIPVDFIITSGNIEQVENDASILIAKIRKK